MAERKASKRLHRIMLIALKVIPMLLAFCAMLNMFFDFFGIDSSVLSMTGGISLLPLAFLYVASYVFQFCIYHRMFLHYILANNSITWLDYYVGIPVDILTLFVIHVFLIGLFLFLILYFYRRERCCKR